MKRSVLIFTLGFTISKAILAQGPLIDDGLSDEDWELCISMDQDESVAFISKFAPFVIFYLEKVNGEWSEQKLFPFSGRFQSGGPDVSLDGKAVFFSSNRSPFYDSAQTNSDLWVSYCLNGSWNEPIHLGTKINSAADELSPSVAKNGNLYFMIDATDGFGGYDIYFSERIEGEYQEPTNLGPSINTSYNEEDPFIDPDERFMLFMSQRPGGPGPCNIYISLKDEGEWQGPILLSDLINSPFCNYSPYLSQNDTLYFISYSKGVLDGVNRQSYESLSEGYRKAGNGKADIFKIKWKPNLDSLKRMIK